MIKISNNHYERNMGVPKVRYTPPLSGCVDDAFRTPRQQRKTESNLGWHGVQVGLAKLKGLHSLSPSVGARCATVHDRLRVGCPGIE